MITELILTIIAAVLFGLLLRRIRNHFTTITIVTEQEFALHYRYGKFIGLLEAGRHRFFGAYHTVNTLDKRATEIVINGQELLTKDQASLKISGLVRYRITDPERYVNTSATPEAVLYSAAQIAFRDTVSQTSLEDVLSRNLKSSEELAELVQVTGEQLGVKVETVIVKDLMPSGEIKGVLTDALLAKKRALIELERARGEAAALRIKSNTASLYEKHPSLLQLELIQALEANGLGCNNSFSFGGMEQFKQLMNGKE